MIIFHSAKFRYIIWQRIHVYFQHWNVWHFGITSISSRTAVRLSPKSNNNTPACIPPPNLHKTTCTGTETQTGPCLPPPPVSPHLCARLQPLVHLVDPVLGLDHVGRVSPVEGSERGRVEGVVGWIGHGVSWWGARRDLNIQRRRVRQRTWECDAPTEDPSEWEAAAAEAELHSVSWPAEFQAIARGGGGGNEGRRRRRRVGGREGC